jgi:hypothetical protein
MRTLRIASTLIAGFAAVAAFAVIASTPAEAWYCSARGTTGSTGWGTSPNRAYAAQIALRECAVRTPRNARCYLMYCN